MQMIKMDAASARENPLPHITTLLDGIKVSAQNHSSINNIGSTGFLKRLAYL
jgi:hypothetical protein